MSWGIAQHPNTKLTLKKARAGKCISWNDLTSPSPNMDPGGTARLRSERRLWGETASSLPLFTEQQTSTFSPVDISPSLRALMIVLFQFYPKVLIRYLESTCGCRDDLRLRFEGIVLHP
jgi:hypothetical protein